MIGWPEIAAFNLALLAAWSAPGPAMLYFLKTALSSGRAAGMMAGAGTALAAALWTLAALLGLDALFALFPWAYTAMKLFGAAYLFWIAWTTWRGADAPLAADPEARRRAFRGGLILNLGNPKAVLFAAAVLVVIFPPGMGAAGIALVALNHLALELALYGSLVLAVTTPAVSRRYLALKPRLDRGAALVMGALGLRLLADRP